MPERTRTTPEVLTPDDLAFFREHGYVRLPGAIPSELALEMQKEIWAEVRADHGIDPNDRSTWRTLPRSPSKAKEHPLNAELASERFQGAISDLPGYETWDRPRTWGGFLVNFPDESARPWDVRADHWHWDGSPSSEGLLIFSFYASVRPGGGGTLILSGSPRLIADFYASLSEEERALAHKVHRKMFASWDPWLEDLTGRALEPATDRIATFVDRTTEVRGVPCRVVELTGEPGDVVFCNLGMYHSASPNCTDDPRVMRVKFLFLDQESGTPPGGARLPKSARSE